MGTVSLDGLPKPVAQAIATMVEKLRQQFREQPEKRQKINLITRPGRVYGRLTREEIYDDVV
ncbi:MAG: hypothetical protein ACODAJ_11795 [Planctomycetota bacterium]